MKKEGKSYSSSFLEYIFGKAKYPEFSLLVQQRHPNAVDFENFPPSPWKAFDNHGQMPIDEQAEGVCVADEQDKTEVAILLQCVG